MITSTYMSLDKIKDLCGNKFHVTEIHEIGNNGSWNSINDIPDTYAVYAYNVDRNNAVEIYIGMAKETIMETIGKLKLKPLHRSFNAVNTEEMVEYFGNVNEAIQFMECGVRSGILEPCGEGFYAY